MTDDAMLGAFRRRAILRAQELGNVSRACREFGISRTTGVHSPQLDFLVPRDQTVGWDEEVNIAELIRIADREGSLQVCADKVVARIAAARSASSRRISLSSGNSVRLSLMSTLPRRMSTSVYTILGNGWPTPG